jgi:prevent-host-death family protein
MRSVSAAEANRQFSRIMREAAAGETVVVTSRGKPVIEIRPVVTVPDEKQTAFTSLMKRLGSQTAHNLPRASRDDMYD